MTIRFLQWNILYKETARDVLSVLRRLRPDIACLQETTLDSDYNRGVNIPNYLGDRLGLHSYFHVAQVYEPKTVHTVLGNAILSRWPLSARTFHYLQDPSDGTPSPTKGGRVYISATTRIEGTPLTVATTHLSLYPFFRNGPIKQSECNRLEKLIRGKRSRFIFSGDLNALPGSRAVRMLERHLDPCGPDNASPTFANKMYSYKTFIAERLEYRIDHVFSTPDIRVTKAVIPRVRCSDHLPILLEFNF